MVYKRFIQNNKKKKALDIPKLGNKMVKEDRSFKPGQVKARAQPLSTPKGSEAAAARVPLLQCAATSLLFPYQ